MGNNIKRVSNKASELNFKCTSSPIYSRQDRRPLKRYHCHVLCHVAFSFHLIPNINVKIKMSCGNES